jgi:transmembrane sensor
MEELFRKCLDNQCSPEEVNTLLAYLTDRENEARFRKLIFESFDNSDTEENDSQFQEAADRLILKIEKKISAENGKVAFFRTNWFRIAAAAILIAGGFSLYNYYSHNTTTNRETARVDTPANEIRPGGNKAVVTLSDGSSINLEKALNDTLSKQGSTSLIKLADGQLSYKSMKEGTAVNLFNSVATPRGGQYQLLLSDGSVVWLNAASSIRFPVEFTGRERVVELNGEAYFEIVKNESMPFKVRMANKAIVEVLGTHFNINAYTDESSINTTLLEGSVKVTGLVHNNSRIIVPGQQVQLDADGRIQINKQANGEQVIAWKNGIFNFHHADLEMALRQIARWYDVDIVFEGPILQKKFNGEMQRTLNLSQVVKLLEKSAVYCRIEGKKLIVVK